MEELQNKTRQIADQNRDKVSVSLLCRKLQITPQLAAELCKWYRAEIATYWFRWRAGIDG